MWAYRYGRSEFEFNEDKYKVYDFKDLPAAKQRMQSDAHVGKIVVRV